MVLNFPGPYEVEITYVTNGRPHKLRISCSTVGTPTPGDAPSSITLGTRNSVGAALDTSVLAFVNVLKTQLATADSFTGYDFWKYAPTSFERTFITSGTLAVSGTAVVSSVVAQQNTYTFRTQEGGIFRLILLESVHGGDNRVVYASLTANQKLIVDNILAAGSWQLARDTSYPIVFLRQSNGQNEAVWRKIYRS